MIRPMDYTIQSSKAYDMWGVHCDITYHLINAKTETNLQFCTGSHQDYAKLEDLQDFLKAIETHQTPILLTKLLLKDKLPGNSLVEVELATGQSIYVRLNLIPKLPHMEQKPGLAHLCVTKICRPQQSPIPVKHKDPNTLRENYSPAPLVHKPCPLNELTMSQLTSVMQCLNNTHLWFYICVALGVALLVITASLVLLLHIHRSRMLRQLRKARDQLESSKQGQQFAPSKHAIFSSPVLTARRNIGNIQRRRNLQEMPNTIYAVPQSRSISLSGDDGPSTSSSTRLTAASSSVARQPLASRDSSIGKDSDTRDDPLEVSSTSQADAVSPCNVTKQLMFDETPLLSDSVNMRHGATIKKLECKPLPTKPLL